MKTDRTWLEHLDSEDLAFIKRLVLSSGSLKELAEAYGVSYPTVRLRLDRLIERIEILDSKKIASEFERVARVQFAAGRLDASALRTLLAAHRKELEVAREKDSRHGREPHDRRESAPG